MQARMNNDCTSVRHSDFRINYCIIIYSELMRTVYDPVRNERIAGWFMRP